MTEISQNDQSLMGYLQKQGPQSVAQLAEWMEVTETAVRQRLTRLIAQGLVSRVEQKLSRGRPVHKYSVTREGRALAGQNFLDLVTVVWDEVRAIEDEEVRSQVVRGIAKRLAAKYQEEIESEYPSNANNSNVNTSNDKDSRAGSLSLRERADQIARFFENRGIPVTVNEEPQQPGREQVFPILQLHGCPYPGLSERDKLICEMEQSMFSELAGCDVELHRCQGNTQSECCKFQLESVSKG